MGQKYKVFIEDIPVYFGEYDELFLEDAGCVNGDNVQNFSELRVLALQSGTCVSVKNSTVPLYHPILSEMRHMKAAGGVVLNGKRELLAIKRLGRWDLPKGKIEYGEDVRAAAVREVEEECGVTHPVITRNLCETYHTYAMGDIWVIKQTSWFMMQMDGVPALTAQSEEQITDVRWMTREAVIHEMKADTYPAIVDVLRSAGY
jgi:8-oxo-dGTP pyrophosphatase MutT (NUDIX family)